MIQTAGQQQSEATAFVIILIVVMLILYIYYGWVRPIKNLQDKSKPKAPSILTLIIAIIPIIFIAWAIYDEIRRVMGLRTDVAVEAPAPVGTVNVEEFKGTFQQKGNVALGVPPKVV